MRRLLPFLFFTFVLSQIGCSRLIMDQAIDTLTVSRADTYFDLNSQQKDQLRADVKRDVEGIKREVLPQVAKSLRDLDKDITGSPEPDQMMARIFSDSEMYLKKISARFGPTALKTASTFSDDQFDHFAKKVKEDIRETAEETATPDAALKRSLKKYERGLEFWLGSLTRDQKKSLKTFLASHPYPWELQNKNKQAMMEKFLAARKNPEEFKSFITQFTQDWDVYRMPEFKTAVQDHRRAFEGYFAKTLWPSLQPSQKNELKENLISRAEKIEDLARR